MWYEYASKDRRQAEGKVEQPQEEHKRTLSVVQELCVCLLFQSKFLQGRTGGSQIYIPKAGIKQYPPSTDQVERFSAKDG